MSRPTVLIVDDEVLICDTVSAILQNAGINARTANHATEAMAVLGSRKVDLLIVDVMMPDIDGLSFIRRLRTNPRYAQIPVIVASARASAPDRAEALDAGASAFLVKPFTTQQLRGIVQRFLPEQSHPSIGKALGGLPQAAEDRDG